MKASSLVGAMLSLGALLPPASAAPPPAPWPMFHRDERHTGLATGAGNVNPASGPVVRWKYRVTAAPTTEEQLRTYRWYSSFPIGDLDGDGTLEVVVTTPDNSGEPDRVIALKDVPGQDPPVKALWTYTLSGSGHGSQGVDQYGAALADCDGDGLLDVLFTSKDGFVRALKGINGSVIWETQTGYFIEAGPMVGDLDGDGKEEVVVSTGCPVGSAEPPNTCTSPLLVFAARPAGGGPSNPPLWSREYPYKIDSSEAALADLDPTDGKSIKALVFGSWGGFLEVLWRNADGSQVAKRLDLRTLDSTIHAGAPTALRSSPLLADFGQGLTAVFGWMPDWQIGTQARVSGVGIAASTATGEMTFTPRWTMSRDDWKSSPALLPLGSGAPLAVTGYGIGTDAGTGSYGICSPVSGGIVAMKPNGAVAWEKVLGPAEGNVRGSPVVADVDGDGKNEVLLTVGCYGKLHCYDGETGAEEWSFQLGPRTIAGPSFGDLDGDGTLEIVVASYDGNVWALGGAPPAAPEQSWILPSAARVVSGFTGALFTTDLTVAATGASDATFTLKFLRHDADGRSGAERTFSLGPGRSVTYADLLSSVFGLESDFGAVQVRSASSGLVVQGKTWTPSAGGTIGQAVPAAEEGDLIKSGASRSIVGVRETAGFRTNLVLANARAVSVIVRLQLVSRDGVPLGAKEVFLPPLGMTQIAKVARELGASGEVTDARLVLSTATPEGAFAAYASEIDNATNDPRTFLPR